MRCPFAAVAVSMILIALAAGCGGTPESVGTGSTNSSLQSFFAPGDASLAARASAKGIVYGAATTPNALADARFATAFAAECKVLVTENALKWRDLSATPYSYDFSAADALLSFARSHNLTFRGHTLVSHDTVPGWFQATVTPENAQQVLRGHIAGVVGRYAGQMHSWDVVNEAVEPSELEPGGLRGSSPWYRLLGPGYIEQAFRAAAEADPKALLVYNENWLEYDTPYCGQKRGAVLDLLAKLKAAGAPIHALGIQAHLDADLMLQNFDAVGFRAFLSKVAALGLKIMITELDVRDRNLPADADTRDAIVAGIYHKFLSVALSEPAVIAVETWGLSDNYTWNSTYYPRSDGLPVRPLPLDDAMKRKRAWHAIAQAFDSAAPR